MYMYTYTNQTCTCTHVLTCPSDACTYTTITPVCSSIVLTGLDIIGGYDPVDVFTFTLIMYNRYIQSLVWKYNMYEMNTLYHYSQ